MTDKLGAGIFFLLFSSLREEKKSPFRPTVLLLNSETHAAEKNRGKWKLEVCAESAGVY